MPEIYLAEAAYEALFTTTIDANSYPTTANYDAVENYFAYYLNGKLGISSSLTSQPGLSMARLWVGNAIYLFGQYCKAGENFVSPEKFTEMTPFMELIARLDPLVDDIRDTLSTELAPAYYYDTDIPGGGTRL